MTGADIERLVRLETEMCEVRDDVREVGRDVKGLRAEVKEWMREADNRYAAKLVERVVYGMVTLTLIASFTAILSLVMK